MEGVPGLAKTLMVKTLSQALDLSFRRIQFTPDLMPTDIIGTEILEEDHATGKRFFKFNKGPLFANIILADEISPDTCRLWDKKTKEKLDKEFKDGLTKLQDKLKAYKTHEKWTFIVTKWTVDAFLKDRRDLLADKKEEPAGEARLDAKPPLK